MTAIKRSITEISQASASELTKTERRRCDLRLQTAHLADLLIRTSIVCLRKALPLPCRMTLSRGSF